MPIELKVPAVGESITEVQIGEWLKNEGDLVSKDEPVVLVETDKANVEIPSPESGVLMSIVKQVGDLVSVGGVIAQIETDGTVTAKAEGDSKSDKEPENENQSDPESIVMPSAKRILEQSGKSPDEVQPSGPGGRLLKEDAQQAIHSANDKKEGSDLANKTVSTSSGSGNTYREEKIVPMSPLRRSIAKSLVEAQQQGALLTTFNEIDMSGVMDLRARFKEDFIKKHGVKLGFMSFFIKACIDALKQFPGINAEIKDNSIIYKNYYDIGVAVGGGKGLVVPVIRDANHLSFAELELKIGELAKKAKENRLTIDELQGGTFTLTNGGIYGSMLSTPIINPPQSAILAVGAGQKIPIVNDDKVVICNVMNVTLSCDHRAIDGAVGAKFLQVFKKIIENPMLMSL